MIALMFDVYPAMVFKKENLQIWSMLGMMFTKILTSLEQ